MRGQVISVDGVSGDGLISGDDGNRYTFTASAARTSLRAGDKVDFLGLDGVASDVMHLSGAPASGGGDYHPAERSGPGYDFAFAMFSFQRRLRRSHFWISWAILFFGGFIVGLIPFVGLFAWLASIWANLAIQVKRLHDFGQTGWWVVGPIVANIVGTVMFFTTVGLSGIMNAERIEQDDPAAFLALMGPMFGILAVLTVINLGFLIWIGSVDSQRGSNKYGRSPKYRSDDAANTFN